MSYLQKYKQVDADRFVPSNKGVQKRPSPLLEPMKYM